MFQRLHTVSVLRHETYLEDAVSSLQNVIADKVRTVDNVKKKKYHSINIHHHQLLELSNNTPIYDYSDFRKTEYVNDVE
jgi:hypothetical protein